MSSDDPRDDSRFTHQEMRLIFERAGISEATRDDSRRYSLAEVEAIGVEAGLDPSDIRRAAATVRDVSATHWLLGAPTRFHASHFLDHPLEDDRLAEIVEMLRLETSLHGELRFVPDGVEWRARPALGGIIVHFAPRRNGTRISVLVAREDAAVLAVVIGCCIGFVAGVAAGIAVAIASHGNAILSLPAFLFGTVGAAYGSMRLIWKRAASRAAAVTRSLVGTIVSLTEPRSGDAPA